MYISKLFSNIYKPFLESIQKNNPYRNIKQNMHKHQTQIFKELVPSILPLLKEQIRLGMLVSSTIPSNLPIPD